MPKRLVNNTVFIRRNGRQVSPTIGKTFDFTKEELESIERTNKTAVSVPPAPVQEFQAAGNSGGSQTKTASTNKSGDSNESNTGDSNDSKSGDSKSSNSNSTKTGTGSKSGAGKDAGKDDDL